jgi:hypothetical protein
MTHPRVLLRATSAIGPLLHLLAGCHASVAPASPPASRIGAGPSAPAGPPVTSTWRCERLAVGESSVALVTIPAFHSDSHAAERDGELRRVVAEAAGVVLDLRGASDGDAVGVNRLTRLLEQSSAARPTALVVDERCGSSCQATAALLDPRRVMTFPSAPSEAPLDVLVRALRKVSAQLPPPIIRAPAAFAFTSETQKDEARALGQLGLRLPGEGILLPRPFPARPESRAYVVPGAWLTAQVPRLVSASALRADLAVLQPLMAQAYAGWKRAQQLGWDWDGWFKAWDAQLLAAGNDFLPLERAFAPVRQLQAFQLDNHTTIPLGLKLGSGSQTYVLAQEPTGTCRAWRGTSDEHVLNPIDPAQRPRKALRFDGNAISPVTYLALPAGLGAASAIHCQDRWIALRLLPSAGKAERLASILALGNAPSDRPTFRHLSDTVSYLRLPSFSKVNGEILSRERRQWDRPRGTERLLLVDLRGNRGGDVALDALADWIDQKELRDAVYFDRSLIKSCLYHSLRWGYTRVSMAGLRPPLSDQTRQNLQAELDELSSAGTASCETKLETLKAKRHYQAEGTLVTPRPGKPLIVALVDGNCGSDCELLAASLGKLPEVLVVGVNTYGVMQFVHPGYSVLPNTRLPFRIALGTADPYGDGRSADGYGLDVDLLLDGAGTWQAPGLLRLADLLIATKRGDSSAATALTSDRKKQP